MLHNVRLQYSKYYTTYSFMVLTEKAVRVLIVNVLPIRLRYRISSAFVGRDTVRVPVD